MARWPQFSLGYLLLLVFWWALAFAMIHQILPDRIGYRQPNYGWLCYTLLPMALGPAYGGLVLRMRFGFYAGAVISVLMWLYLVCGGER